MKDIQLDLFNNLPIQHKPEPKIVKANYGNVKIIPKEKPTYPFDTPQGIDHVTRVLKEESSDKLSPKEEANLNILNKEMKLSVLKDELGGIKPFDNLNPESYPTAPEQRRRLKNISALEKSLGYNSPENNVPYKKDIRTPNQKKADSWEANKRAVQQLRDLKEWGRNPLTKTNYSKGGTVNNSNSWNDFKKGKLSNIIKDKSPSTWDIMKQTAKSPQEIKDIRDTVNSHVRSIGHTKFVAPDEVKYLDKKEEPKVYGVVHDRGLDILAEKTTAPEPVTRKPVEQIIKELADARLEAEQKDWDRRYGKGGLPSLKRPE